MTTTSEVKTPPCIYKHTKFQANGPGEWQCPRCGTEEGFYIEDSPNFECEEIHVEDSIGCEKCERGWSGQAAMNAIVKKLSLIDCPTCTDCLTCKGSRKIKNPAS